MSPKGLVRCRVGVAILLYLMIYFEYTLVYPSKNDISPVVPFITVIGIIVCVTILIGVERIIFDFKSMEKNINISYLFQSITVLFLIIMILPEVANSYLSTTMIYIILTVFTVFHFVLLEIQNRDIGNNKLNLFGKILEIEKKFDNINDSLYYKYSNFLLKINLIYIFIFSFNSLILRRAITIIYACCIVYVYHKMKRNLEIVKLNKQRGYLYELYYKLFSLLLIFIFSKYLNGLLAVVILSTIILPTRRNISNFLRKKC